MNDCGLRIAGCGIGEEEANGKYEGTGEGEEGNGCTGLAQSAPDKQKQDRCQEWEKRNED